MAQTATVTKIRPAVVRSMGTQFSDAWIVADPRLPDEPAVLRRYNDGSWDMYDIGFGCSPRFSYLTFPDHLNFARK